MFTPQTDTILIVESDGLATAEGRMAWNTFAGNMHLPAYVREMAPYVIAALKRKAKEF